MKRLLMILTVCALVSMLFVGNALAHTAYSFGTLYVDGVDTRGAAQNVKNTLSSIGYTANYVPGVSASTAISDMRSGQVWFFNGHGNAGYVLCYDGSNTYVTGSYYYGGTDYPISQWSDGSLNDIALSVFVACNSGNSDGTFGNLLTASTNNGVDTALGFSSEIDAGKSDYWAQQFATHLDEQKNVGQSAAEAANDCYWHYFPGGNGGTGNYVISGSSSATIDPARAGN